MEESVTYQAIVREGLIQGRAEGALEEARKMLLRLGETHFQTPPPAKLQRRVARIEDLDQLEQLMLNVTQLRSWDELLPAPAKPRRRKSSPS
jgi:hypothetical protein